MTDREQYQHHENAKYKEFIKKENNDYCSLCEFLMQSIGRKLHFTEEGKFLFSTHGDCE